MRIRKTIEFNQAVHQAARAFAAMDYLDQDNAQEIGALALAIIEACMVVNYQAGTGLASRADFRGPQLWLGGICGQRTRGHTDESSLSDRLAG